MVIYLVLPKIHINRKRHVNAKSDKSYVVLYMIIVPYTMFVYFCAKYEWGVGVGVVVKYIINFKQRLFCPQKLSTTKAD